MDQAIGNSNPGNDMGSGDGVEPQVTPVQQTNTQTPGSNSDWEGKYKGLQATYNKLYGNHTDITAKYNQAVEEKENALQEVNRLKAELANALENLTDKDKSIQDSQSSVEARTREYERLKLISTKYPGLVNLEINGLIPDIKQEELDTKLKILNDTIMEQIDAKATNTLKHTPPGSTQLSNNMPPMNDLDAIYAKLDQLAGQKTPEAQAEYDRLYATYLELTKKK